MANILLIDDESSIRHLFREVLEGEGYHVLEVSSAQAGLHLLREHPIDLVMTDIVMPDMDGLEVTRLVHQEFPHVKVIALSGGRQDMDYCEVARSLGAHDTLMKPVSIQQLRETVAKVLSAPA